MNDGVAEYDCGTDYAACHGRMREALARCRVPTQYDPDAEFYVMDELAVAKYGYPTDAFGNITGIMSPIDNDDFIAGRWGPKPHTRYDLSGLLPVVYALAEGVRKLRYGTDAAGHEHSDADGRFTSKGGGSAPDRPAAVLSVGDDLVYTGRGADPADGVEFRGYHTDPNTGRKAARVIFRPRSGPPFETSVDPADLSHRPPPADPAPPPEAPPEHRPVRAINTPVTPPTFDGERLTVTPDEQRKWATERKRRQDELEAGWKAGHDRAWDERAARLPTLKPAMRVNGYRIVKDPDDGRYHVLDERGVSFAQGPLGRVKRAAAGVDPAAPH